MCLELDEETRRTLGWGDVWASARWHYAWTIRRKSIRDWARRDHSAERARDRARSKAKDRSRTAAYMERKRKRDRERQAAKRAAAARRTEVR